MRIEHLALQTLTEEKGNLVDETGEAFDSVGYSRFKHGYTPPARAYGMKLASLLIREHTDPLIDPRPLVVLSAPYLCLPTASHAIAQQLAVVLNMSRAFDKVSPVIVPHFRKLAAGLDTYATLPMEEREAVLNELELQIDPALITNANVLVVDDIRISGTAERRTAMHIEPMQPHAVWYLHAAALNEELGMQRPDIESTLNRTFETTLNTIRDDMQRGEFTLNTRVLRLILTCSDDQARTELALFCQWCPEYFLEQIHASILGNGHDYIARYRDSYDIVTRAARRRHLAFVPYLFPV